MDKMALLSLLPLLDSAGVFKVYRTEDGATYYENTLAKNELTRYIGVEYDAAKRTHQFITFNTDSYRRMMEFFERWADE